MDRYAEQAAERKIDDMTYPAKLPKAQKRLLVSKLWEIKGNADKRRSELVNAMSALSQEKNTKLEDLPSAAKVVAKKLLKAEADLAKLRESLKTLGVRTYSHMPGSYYVTMPPAEYAAKQAEAQRAINQHDADTTDAIEGLRAIAKGLAEAQVAELKAKIAKTAPDVVAKLDAISTLKALPAATVVEEPPKKKLSRAQQRRVKALLKEASDVVEEVRESKDVPKIISAVKRLKDIEQTVDCDPSAVQEVNQMTRNLRLRAMGAL